MESSYWRNPTQHRQSTPTTFLEHQPDVARHHSLGHLAYTQPKFERYLSKRYLIVVCLWLAWQKIYIPMPLWNLFVVFNLNVMVRFWFIWIAMEIRVDILLEPLRLIIWLRNLMLYSIKYLSSTSKWSNYFKLCVENVNHFIWKGFYKL